MNPADVKDEGLRQQENGDGGSVEVLVSLVEKGLKKTFYFDPEDKVWDAKKQVITELAKGSKDVLNYGFYDPPFNGKSGKFLEEERTFRDYPLKGSPPLLELKYKRRVYRSMAYEPKVLQKIHTKVNLKKLLDAVAANNPSQVARLTEKGLDPNFHVEKTGETPLSQAVVKDGSRETIMTLINGGAHLDFRTKDSYTPLHKAAIAGKSHAVQTLLDFGASTNYRDQKGLTPLCYTVQRGGNAQCCEILLNDHAEIHVTDHQGMQPIHVACKNGLIQHLEHLLFYGVDKDSTTASGNTSLHISALSNQEDCARVLLFRGAKRDILNYANQSAHEVAAVGGNNELAELIRTFSDASIVKISEKPTYSTRRRKSISKPRASSLFLRADSEGQLSGKSDSLPPSPVSSTYSLPSSETSLGDRSNSMTSDGSRQEADSRKFKRTLSVGSTASDSSYESESEVSGESSTNEIRSQKRAMKQESSSSMMAPPVKFVSGAATIRKRLYASGPGKKFMAVRDYQPTRAGELPLEKGDMVEVLFVGEKGYWEGRVGNQTGWFHHKCVEEVKKGKQRPKTLFGRPPSLSSMFAHSETQEFAQQNQQNHGSRVEAARVVTLVRNKAGFGFQMRGANSQVPRLNFRPTPEFPALQYIGEVEKDGEAHQKGVKCNDFIIEVNNENISTATHSHVVDLIKRSGATVTIKLVTVRTPHVNGTDEMDWGGEKRGLKPPPPQRDPATTLTLLRMKSTSRPSLYEMSMGNNYEEPASFKMDSVIAVSKDTRWSTLQREKPGSRKGAQLRMQSKPNAATSGKSRKGTPLRSKSVQDMAAPPPPYESLVGNRKLNVPVAVATPQVPYGSSVGYSPNGTGTLTKHSLSSKSTPNLDCEDSPRKRVNGTMQRPYSCASSEELLYPQHGLPNGSAYEAEPLEATVVAVGVEESRPAAEVTIVATPVVEHSPMAAHIQRSKSHPSLKSDVAEDDVFTTPGEMPGRKAEPVSLSDALQEAVAARTARMSRQSSEPEVNEKPAVSERKISAPAQLNSRKKLEPVDRVRSVIMEQLRGEFDLEDNRVAMPRRGADGSFGLTPETHVTTSPTCEQGPRQIVSSVAARAVRAPSGNAEYSTLPRRSSESSASSNKRHSTPVSPVSGTEFIYDNRPTNHQKPGVLTRHGSLKRSRKGRERGAESGALNPALSAHANINSAPAANVNAVRCKPQLAPRPPSITSAAGLVKEVPLTAVRAGLITADALSAKKTKLKSVTEKSKVTSKPTTLGRPARAQSSGPSANEPRAIGDQHATLLAKAVAARAARIAERSEPISESESKDDEWSNETRHAVPVCRTNDTNNNRGGASDGRRSNANFVAKPSPPVAPKKKRISPSKVVRPQSTEREAPRSATLTAGKRGSHNYPSSVHAASRNLPFDLPAPILSEEDQTMMIFDEIIRLEAESENWSLNSWTGSDSSSEVHGSSSSGTSEVDGRGRPVRISSESRPSEQRSLVRTTSEKSRPSEQRPLVRTFSECRPSEQRPLVRVSSECRPSEQRPTRYLSDNKTYEPRSAGHSPGSHPMKRRPVQPSTESLKEENPAMILPESLRTDKVPSQCRPRDAPSGSAPPARPWYECPSLPEEDPDTVSEPQMESYDKLITTKKGIQIKLRFETKSPPTTPSQTDYNAIDNVVPVNLRLNAPAVSSPPQSPGKKTGLKETHFGGDNFAIPPPPVAFEDERVTVVVVESPELPPPPPEFFPTANQSTGASRNFEPPASEDLRRVESPRRIPNDAEELNAEPMNGKEEESNNVKDLPSIFGEAIKSGSFLVKPVLEWSCEDVCDWLKSISMSQYESTFVENDIRGIHLPELTKAELRELGIKSLGHRMTMENAIAKLSQPLESSC